MPDTVVQRVAQYQMPQYTWPLLHLAGVLGEDRFLESTAWCPAYPVIVMHHLALGLTSSTALAISAEEFVSRVARVPVAVLCKLVPHSADWRTIELLSDRWGSLPKRIQRTLRVVPRITRDTIRCLASLPSPDVLTPALVHACQRSSLYEISSSVVEARSNARGEWMWSHISDYETLLSLPHRLGDPTAHFGVPPFAPVYGIEALETPEAIVEEDREQEIGLADSIEHLRERGRYAYHMFFPERATIVLVHVPEEDNWRLSLVAARRRQPIHETSMQYVLAWIRSNVGLE